VVDIQPIPTPAPTYAPAPTPTPTLVPEWHPSPGPTLDETPRPTFSPEPMPTPAPWSNPGPAEPPRPLSVAGSYDAMQAGISLDGTRLTLSRNGRWTLSAWYQGRRIEASGTYERSENTLILIPEQVDGMPPRGSDAEPSELAIENGGATLRHRESSVVFVRREL
jgi:hypothetical protein